MIKGFSIADSGRGWFKVLAVKGAASMAALNVAVVIF